MTIDLLRRLSGSTVAALFAVAIAAGCSENRGPVGPSGTGGDVGPIPPSPLCGATNLPARAVARHGGVVMPTPASSSRRSSRSIGSTVAAAVPPPAISGGTLRILADGHTAVAADPDRDQVYIVDLVEQDGSLRRSF